MRDERGGVGSGRSRRAGVVAVSVAAAAVLLAACGPAGSATGSSGASGSSPYQNAVAFAQCMRSHGAPSFPDPDSQGEFIMTPANSADYHAPASANQACAHFRPDGGTKTAEVTTPREMTAMLKYTACMRSHGEPDFPDPSAGGGFSLAGANIDVSAPQFQAAQQTCQKIAPW